jgi:hypothetical protein
VLVTNNESNMAVLKSLFAVVVKGKAGAQRVPGS